MSYEAVELLGRHDGAYSKEVRISFDIYQIIDAFK